MPVLVFGESGVGKELVARAVHDSSPRSDRPYIPLNCGAIPETMLESELFGHEKGAFTGAFEKKLGILEIADKGTLFLDEVGELPLALQVKLLRVIETGRFFRVGGVKEVSVDVKFISASNKDLKAAAEDGTFRSDLYYRISALTIHIPPLRERREDIPLLIDHYLKGHPAFKQKKFSKNALETLVRYAWPGNIRELQNLIHRTLLLAPGTVIEESDLPADLAGTARTSSRRLADLEREHILAVVREVEGPAQKSRRCSRHRPQNAVPKVAGLRGEGMSIGRRFTLGIGLTLVLVMTVTTVLVASFEQKEEREKIRHMSRVAMRARGTVHQDSHDREE